MDNVAYKLSHLTIKPFHWCSHNCPYCDSRQELFHESTEATLGLEDWARVFKDANDLGTDYLDVSGGEPTLYKALPSLIWEAKQYGWYVSLNSTGFFIPEKLDQLIDVCLDQVIISIVSIDEQTHDDIRKTPGSFAGAMKAIDLLKKTSMRVIIHFIISKNNYHELPDLIDFAFANEINGIALVYPENDHREKYLLLTEQDIAVMRNKVLPESMQRYVKHYPESDQSHANLAGLFAAHGIEGNFANGRYFSDIDQVHAICKKPETFALIYANGNVLPCNAVEYTHAPFVGNVLRQSLKEIWAGEAYEQFRKSKMAFCNLCPINRHTGISISTLDNPPYAAPVVLHVPDRFPSKRPAVPPGHLNTRIPRRSKQAPTTLIPIETLDVVKDPPPIANRDMSS